MADLFKLVGSIFIDTNEALDSLKKVDKDTESFGQKLGNLGKTAGKVAVGLGTAVAGVGTAIYKATTEAGANLDAIQKGAQKMNMSYDSYQSLSYVLSRNGAEMSSLSKGIKKMIGDLDDLANGSKKASEKYDALGVSMYNMDGTMRTSEELLFQTIYALADMEDVTKRNAMAQDIFGNSYTELIPMLNSGGDAIEDLVFKADELGLVLSDDMVDAGASFCDQLDDVKDSLNIVMTKIGAQLMPVVQTALAWVMEHMPQIQEFLGQFFSALGEFIQFAIKMIQAVAPVVEKVWEGLIKPILNGVIKFLDFTLSGGFNRMYDTIKSTCDRAIQPFRNMVDSLKNAWSSLTSSLKMPHFSISGTFSLKPLSVPHLGIDWYAKAMENGYIMNQPTIFGLNEDGIPMGGGEAGSEVVVGTHSLNDMIAQAVNETNNAQAQKLDVLIRLVERYLPTIADKEFTIDSDSIYSATNKRATQVANASLKFRGGY